MTQPRVGTSHNEILALQIAAKEYNWEVYSVETSWRLPEDLVQSGTVGVPYGSQTFCEVIAQQMGWTLKQNSFDWLSKISKQWTKRQIDFMTLGEAAKLKETRFIKPADDKVFEAKIYHPGELIPHESIPLDTPTLVSEIVHFDLEYRCFVNSTYVSTWSNYICHEHLADPKYWEMIPGDTLHPSHFVEDMLLNSPHLGTMPSVIDVGRIPGKGWAIIETNQAWASGLYGCDPLGALKVMEVACSKNY